MYQLITKYIKITNKSHDFEEWKPTIPRLRHCRNCYGYQLESKDIWNALPLGIGKPISTLKCPKAKQGDGNEN